MRKSPSLFRRLPRSQNLQCGRIYKDAEIADRVQRGIERLCSFNVAASIKMRKYTGRGMLAGIARPFNVAASIKMRKFRRRRGKNSAHNSLQCGRIYKDAEIRQREKLTYSCSASFNVAASIKMRKW